jgi:hypothetical protein
LTRQSRPFRVDARGVGVWIDQRRWQPLNGSVAPRRLSDEMSQLLATAAGLPELSRRLPGSPAASVDGGGGPGRAGNTPAPGLTTRRGAGHGYRRARRSRAGGVPGIGGGPGKRPSPRVAGRLHREGARTSPLAPSTTCWPSPTCLLVGMSLPLAGLPGLHGRSGRPRPDTDRDVLSLIGIPAAHKLLEGIPPRGMVRCAVDRPVERGTAVEHAEWSEISSAE